MSKALNYNEKKVQQGQAIVLKAINCLKNADDMSFYDKLATFEKLTSLNERATTNVLHVSLNFDPSEVLDNDKLVTISKDYMQGIGFGDQPYLIYRHNDTGHTHIHIVSTNIKSDGNRISMHNIGRNESETVRKEIEINYGLVQAESKKLADALKLKPVNAQKINQGKRSTKAAISNVLGQVISQYRYCSLAELNAVLNLYNVSADRCGEDSETYKHNGLLYRVLDEQGNKVGTPIKASLFYMKPTLKNLEVLFLKNEELKKPHAKRVRAVIDFALMKKSGMTLKQLTEELKKEKITLVPRQNKEGVIYGVTYVDHHTKCVFNGSDLGKAYSAKMILERTRTTGSGVAPAIAVENKIVRQSGESLREAGGPHAKQGELKLPEIISQGAPIDYIPHQLKKKKKRKKKQLKL